MREKKKLPIGMEFFADVRTRDYYYVDKTGLIKELLNSCGSVNLFTRPRCFGKSLNLDMLKCFFEIGANAALFEGLEISQEEELCKQYFGKYPVLSISLKDVQGTDYKNAYDLLGVTVSEEAERLDYLLDSERLTPMDKDKLVRLIEGNFEQPASLKNSLKLLTRLLYKHYGTKVIVLIDEYDVPLDKAYHGGYYQEMVEMLRMLFSRVLKTNQNLEFAVVTGCLRIARESIFTGLNHFKVRTLLDADYAEYFGFTDREVREMLEYYGIEDTFDQIKAWYDGYHVGDVDIYCPWDVLNQCDKLRISINAPMESHWENSSSNAIIQNMLEALTETTRDQIEALISGDYVEKALIPELTYTDLDSEDMDIRQTYLWSVLFATGYLTKLDTAKNGLHKLVIPNREVQGIYEKKIRSWFKVKTMGYTKRWKNFCVAVKTGHGEKVQELLNDFMSDSISIRDTCTKKEMKENFYHGMLLGLLQAEGSWVVKSNTESGVGYTDIRLELPSEKTGCIIEIKYAENGHFDTACARAMKQIEEVGYTEVLEKNGVQTIHKYGIGCYKKACKVWCVTERNGNNEQ